MDADFQSEDVKVFRQWLLDELASSGRDGRKQRATRKIANTTT
jgi:hypothetical protein